MCVNSRYIVNPTKDFRFYDNLYVNVACGDCEECRSVQHNEMYMRLKREVEWCIKNDYNIYFATLTYKNSHLPTFEVPIFDDNWEMIGVQTYNCFSRKDWTKFYDDIRKPLCRKYGIGVNGSPRMRYFVACEFGDLRGRSHLHALFAIPNSCPPQDFYDLVAQHWRDKHGKIFPQSLEGSIVYDEKLCIWKQEKPFQVNRLDCDYGKACYYCAKYACKETFFYSNENIVKYLKHLRFQKKRYESFIMQKIADENILYKYSCARNELKYVRACLPFHLCSRGFGLSFTEDFADLSNIEIIKKIDKGIDCISDDFKVLNYNYPNYIKTKLFYDVYILNDDGNIYDNARDKDSSRHVRRELNELGKLYKFVHHHKVIENCKIRFSNLFVELKFDTSYREKRKITLPSLHTTSDKFFENLSIYFVDLRYKLPIKFLRKFNSYNGYFSNCSNINLDEKVFSIWNEFSIPNYEARKTFGLSSSTILKNDYSHYLFSNSFYFKTYEEILNILLEYESYSKIGCDAVKRSKRIKLTQINHTNV